MITSVKNQEIVRIRSLLKDAKARKQEGVFIAEGKRFVKDILNTKGYLVEKLFITEGFSDLAVEYKDYEIEVEMVKDHVMESVSDTKTPQGILATVRIPRYEYKDIARGIANILILENVRDPGNMGTIFRTHEAAGGSGIVLLKDCTDPFSPKCARATMGSIIRMPYVHCKETKDLLVLKELGISIMAADLNGEDYDLIDLTKPCAFVIGNEAGGISKESADIADKKIHIPMKGETESLNAAVTAALLSFEAAGQRRRSSIGY